MVSRRTPMRLPPTMTHVPMAGGGPTPLAVFDRFRTKVLAKVQEPELKRYAVMLLAFGAALLPLMAGSAKAALQKVPTNGADTLLMLMGSAMVLLMTPAWRSSMAASPAPRTCSTP